MKLYAIKRKNYEFPYKISFAQNVPFYITYDGCKKAVEYMIREFKRLHKIDVSDEYEIYECNLDLDSFNKVGGNDK